MKDRALILANPEADGERALRRLDPVLDALRHRGVRFDLEVTRTAGQTLELSRQSASRYATLVAAGGDGTVNAVAHGLILAQELQTSLALLPLGTGNDAARGIGLLDLDRAIEVLSSRSPTFRSIDVIEVTCQAEGQTITRYSLVYAAAGFAAQVLRRVTPFVKRLFGPRWCYSAGLLLALVSLRCPRMQVRSSGGRFENRMLLVAAGNCQDAGGGMMRLFPGASPRDGLFQVAIIRALGRFRTLRHLPHLYRGTHTRLPEVATFDDTLLDIVSVPPAEIQVDGEICGLTPAGFVLRPKALRLLVAHPGHEGAA
jgi:diacylglycerol kinase (ATP)